MPVQKAIVAEKIKCVGNHAYIFLEKNVKSYFLGIKFSRKMFSYKQQCTCYLYDELEKQIVFQIFKNGCLLSNL